MYLSCALETSTARNRCMSDGSGPRTGKIRQVLVPEIVNRLSIDAEFIPMHSSRMYVFTTSSGVGAAQENIVNAKWRRCKKPETSSKRSARVQSTFPWHLHCAFDGVLSP